MTIPLRKYNLYFVNKPDEHTRSRYYIGDEDGLWPCKLVSANGEHSIVKTSNLIIPYRTLEFNICKIQQGLIDPMESEGEKNTSITEEEWEMIAEGAKFMKENFH